MALLGGGGGSGGGGRLESTDCSVTAAHMQYTIRRILETAVNRDPYPHMVGPDR